jgi:hypothetical protein
MMQRVRRSGGEPSSPFWLALVAVVFMVGLGFFSYPTVPHARAPVRRLSVSEAVQRRLVELEGQNAAQSRQLQFLTTLRQFDMSVKEVNNIRLTGVIMEADEESLAATSKLQKLAKKLCKLKYGDFSLPYRVLIELEFPEKEFRDNPSQRFGNFTIELASLDIVPYSVYNFLEIARGYKGGGFHSRRDHLVQVILETDTVKEPMAFCEYSENYPHKPGTLGYCGRPPLPCWYINTIDNSEMHGPGSQQKHNPYEADSTFGRFLEPTGLTDIVPRIRSSLGFDGFIFDPAKMVLIRRMNILVPSGPDGMYVAWKESPKLTAVFKNLGSSH